MSSKLVVNKGISNYQPAYQAFSSGYYYQPATIISISPPALLTCLIPKGLGTIKQLMKPYQSLEIILSNIMTLIWWLLTSMMTLITKYYGSLGLLIIIINHCQPQSDSYQPWWLLVVAMSTRLFSDSEYMMAWRVILGVGVDHNFCFCKWFDHY